MTDWIDAAFAQAKAGLDATREKVEKELPAGVGKFWPQTKNDEIYGPATPVGAKVFGQLVSENDTPWASGDPRLQITLRLQSGYDTTITVGKFEMDRWRELRARTGDIIGVEVLRRKPKKTNPDAFYFDLHYSCIQGKGTVTIPAKDPAEDAIAKAASDDDFGF